MSASSSALLDVEFTLALNNRTGRFFFGNDLIRAAGDRVASRLFWRLPAKVVPCGLQARILGRLALIEIEWRLRNSTLDRMLPRIMRRHPVIFMDPREVILHRLSSKDCVLCHDLGPITHPSLYQSGVQALYERAFSSITMAKPHMVFVSYASKSAFIQHYGADFPLMAVVRPPLRPGIADGTEQAVAGVHRPFFLTVGSIGRRKNQVRSIEAFEASGLANAGYSYVLCGGPEPGAEAVMDLAKSVDGVVATGYVSDGQVRWLYRNAAGFVLPSLLEGFGLPVAEAIMHGLVPIVGSGGALHEVAGDSALIVDPESVDEIKIAMLRLARLSPDERERRLTNLRASISRFTTQTMLEHWNAALDVISQA